MSEGQMSGETLGVTATAVDPGHTTEIVDDMWHDVAAGVDLQRKEDFWETSQYDHTTFQDPPLGPRAACRLPAASPIFFDCHQSAPPHFFPPLFFEGLLSGMPPDVVCPFKAVVPWQPPAVFTVSCACYGFGFSLFGGRIGVCKHHWSTGTFPLVNPTLCMHRRLHVCALSLCSQV